MFKVTYEVTNPETDFVDPIVLIDYDGARFSLARLDDDLFGPEVWQVLVERRGQWHYFGDKLYDSFDDATKAIFNDIVLDRFESGLFVHDDFSHIIDAISLTYYDRAA